MNLYLVRHGESIGNTQRGFISGRVDKRGLTQKGKSQIIRIAWQLKNIKFQQILTSPVARTQETATILSNALSVGQKTEEFLNELDHGLAEGHFWWEARQYFPKSRTLKDWHENFDSPYVKGESFRMMSKRVRNGYRHLVNLGQNVNYILVTHQAVVATFMYCHLYGNPKIDPDRYLDFVHSTYTTNGAVIRLFSNKALRLGEKLGPFTPVTSKGETIKFYVSASFTIDKNSLTVKKISTSSQNEDFYLHNKKSYLAKIVNPHQTQTSARLIKLYAYLSRAEIPAPHIVSFDDSDVSFHHPLLIQDFQEGNEEYFCLKRHSSYQIDLQKQIYDSVKKIHSLPLDQVKEFWYPDDWHKNYFSWNNIKGDLYLGEQLDLTIKKLRKMSEHTELLNRIIEKLTQLASHVRSGHYFLVPLHGDLAPQNLIISHRNNQCRLTRILDFERARIGDPLWDLVYYYGWLERENEKAAQVWKGVFWQDLSSEQKQYFELYRILFHAWTVRDGAEYTKNRQRQLLAQKSLEILKEIIID